MDRIRDFTFVLPNILLVTIIPNSEPLENDESSSRAASIRLYNLSDSALDYDLAEPALTLYLPPSGKDTPPWPDPPTYHNFDISSGPFTRSESSKCPFMTSETSRIYAFDLTITYPCGVHLNAILWLRLVVQQSKLLSLLNGNPHSGKARALPWKDWGPAHTRLYEHSARR